MNELMIPVERAVRPVRARPWRKMRMREELLAHLTAVYEQERANLGDDRFALAQAVRRFGDPANLTRELQASVPRLEGWLSTPLIGPRLSRQLDTVFVGRNPHDLIPKPGVSPAQHAFRVAVSVCVVAVFLPGLFAGALGTLFTAVEGSRAVHPDRGILVLSVMSVYTFVAVFLCVAGFHSLTDGFGVRAVGYVAALFLASAAVFLVLRLALPDPLWAFIVDTPVNWFTASVVNMSWVALPLAFARFVQASDGPKRKWADLEISG